jgi:hypothetical protein
MVVSAEVLFAVRIQVDDDSNFTTQRHGLSHGHDFAVGDWSG